MQNKIHTCFEDDKDCVKKITELAKPYRDLGIVGWIPMAAIYKAVDERKIITAYEIINGGREIKLVGYLYFIMRKRPREMIEVKQIVVNKDYLRMGVGKELFYKFAKDVYSEFRNLDIIIQVQEDNVGAIKFYSKLGFEYDSFRVTKSGVKIITMIIKNE